MIKKIFENSNNPIPLFSSRLLTAIILILTGSLALAQNKKTNLSIEDVTKDENQRKLLREYKRKQIENFEEDINDLRKSGFLNTRFDSAEKYDSLTEPLKKPFEWVYVADYKVAVPIDGFLKGVSFNCFDVTTLDIDYPDYEMRISVCPLDFDVKDYFSRVYNGYSLNEKIKQKLLSDLRKRPVFQSDVIFFMKMWSEDLTQKNPEELSINDLTEICLLADIKDDLVAYGSLDPNTIYKKAVTPFMKGFLSKEITGAIHFDFSDSKRNISIGLNQNSSDKKITLDQQIIKTSVSSVQQLLTEDPAMEMLLKAEEYLRDTSKPTSCIAFMFLNSAKQYSAYDTKQMEKRMEAVSKAVQKDLIKDLNSDDPNIRSACISTLTIFQNSDSFQAAKKMLKDKSPRVRLKALDTLRRLGKLSPQIYLILEDDKNYEVRKENVSLLKATTYDDKDLVKFSLKALNDSHPEVRKEAINNLCWSMKINEEVLLALKKLRDDPNEEVREQVEEAIFSIEFRLKDDSILK